LLGSGDNGKSVLLLLLNSMLGKDNVSNIALQDLVSNPFAAARLDGKLANIYTDLKSTALKNEEKIKNLSSGEAMHVENKYQQGFDMVTYATLIFSCNQFPKVYDQSDGFFRRWIIIEFKRKFALGDPDRDEKLKDKLIDDQTEKDLVFSYLMIIAEKLLRTGKFRYPLGHKEIRKLWNANADPLTHFIDNKIIEVEGSRKTKRETYKCYEQYCFDFGAVPLGKGQFGKVFGEEFDEDKIGTKRYWLDIDFKVPKQESLDERQW
jgi:putative DNA primase/helicase